MVRPRRDQTGPSATERIFEAFWGMLSEMSYSEIGVVALSKRANVSPNTLYYHFDGLEDIAFKALDATLDEVAVQSVLAGGSLAPSLEEAMDDGRLFRILTVARSGSTELREMLADQLQSIWVKGACIEPSYLTVEQRSELAFIFAGVTSLMAQAGDAEHWQRMLPTFFSRPLGQGIVETMRGLAERYSSAR